MDTQLLAPQLDTNGMLHISDFHQLFIAGIFYLMMTANFFFDFKGQLITQLMKLYQ